MVDAMIALVLIGCTTIVIVSALQTYTTIVQRERKEHDETNNPSWFEEAGWLYDD